MTAKNDNTCKQLGELISAYFDEQLAPDDRRRVQQHLADCPTCQRRLADYREIRNAIAAGKTTPPADLAKTLVAQLERDQLLTGIEGLAPPPPSRRLKYLKGLAAAAMIVLVTAAAMILIKSPDWAPSPADTELADAKRYAPAKIPPSDNHRKRDKGTASTDQKRAATVRERVPSSLLPKEASQPLSADRPGSIPPTHLAARIQLQADDPPAWMYARDQLVASLEATGVNRIAPANVPARPQATDDAFVAVVQRNRGKPTRRYHTTLLINANAEQIDYLNQAIDRLPAAKRVQPLARGMALGTSASQPAATRAVTTTQASRPTTIPASTQPTGNQLVVIDISIAPPVTQPATQGAAPSGE